VVKREDDPAAVSRNFAVIHEADGRITRVIEKPTEPPTMLKGCGVYLFTPAIFEAIRRTPRSALRGEYELTDAIQVLIDASGRTYVEDLALWDVNVTYPADLLDCNLRLLREGRRSSLVGEGARVAAGARLTDTVVGDRAVVEGPVELEECLVLPDVRVAPEAGRVHRAIFCDGMVWTDERGGADVGGAQWTASSR
jgi:dTDP-glucose pyrophosphorylase